MDITSLLSVTDTAWHAMDLSGVTLPGGGNLPTNTTAVLLETVNTDATNKAVAFRPTGSGFTYVNSHQLTSKLHQICTVINRGLDYKCSAASKMVRLVAYFTDEEIVNIDPCIIPLDRGSFGAGIPVQNKSYLEVEVEIG